MSTSLGAKIKAIAPDSIAAELGIEPGDILLRMNGARLQDYIDFLVYSSEEELNLEILKKSGEVIEIEFEKDSAEPLGLVFADNVFDQTRVCSNHCLFCFVHQLPCGQRASLYVQDDDYRLSFLHGCYITLTNLSEADWQRIERLHLSPLYVSVHATDPAVRRKLLGSKAGGAIMAQLKRLGSAGISVHTQAVICPGINDGAILERTISDLAGLWPGVLSLAVVPVGLTCHREHLYPLRQFTPAEACRVLDQLSRWQQQLLPQLGTRFVFAADEWYLRAGRKFPPETEYEEYPQLDNGVGLIRFFLSEFYRCFDKNRSKLAALKVNLAVITGMAAVGMWQEINSYFKTNAPGVMLTIIPVANEFLGTSVTVTGLLSGKDIIRAINTDQTQGRPLLYLIPQITLKQGETLFLDGIDLNSLAAMVKPKRIAVVPTRASDWLDWIIKEGCVNNWDEQ